LSIAKHGDVTNVYCVIKLQRIENYQFDSPNRIDFSQLYLIIEHCDAGPRIVICKPAVAFQK